MAVAFIDPVAQTFFVDAATYPKGMFVHSVDLVFKQKDTITYQPFTVQLRPTLNGFPHASLIHSSAAIGQVSLNPDKINTVTGVGSDIPNFGNSSKYTRFQFPAPVFLLPGEHALVLFSPSDNYELFISEVGGTRLDGTDRRVEKQPYIGSFFKSQNGSTYTAFQDLDLMFRINACDFTEGSSDIILDNKAPTTNVDFDLIKITTQELNFADTLTNYFHKLTDDSTRTLASVYTGIIADTDSYLDSRQIARSTADRDAVIRVQLQTADDTVSPMVDTSRIHMIAVKNIVNDCGLPNTIFSITNGGSGYTANVAATITGVKGSGATAVAVANTITQKIESIAVTSPGSGYTEGITVTIAAPPVLSGNTTATATASGETDSKGGPALARYITRKVNLADGFDSNMIRVYLTAYQPPEATIEVYYKVLADEDQTNFADRPYVRMLNVEQGDETLLNSIKSQVDTDFLEYLFIPSTTDCSYVGTDGVTYNNFKTFAIKIVMRTSDSTMIPIVRDLRAIALAP